MLAQTDIERERYESRRKAQLDDNTRMKVARLEGEEEGRKKGRKEGLGMGERIGMIRLCGRMLHQPETPIDRLAALSLEDLTRQAEELQKRLPPKGRPKSGRN